MFPHINLRNRTLYDKTFSKPDVSNARFAVCRAQRATELRNSRSIGWLRQAELNPTHSTKSVGDLPETRDRGRSWRQPAILASRERRDGTCASATESGASSFDRGRPRCTTLRCGLHHIAIHYATRWPEPPISRTATVLAGPSEHPRSLTGGSKHPTSSVEPKAVRRPLRKTRLGSDSDDR